MRASSQTLHDANAQGRVDKVVERLHERLAPAPAAEAEAFARSYFNEVAAEDVAERSIDDLYGAALSHLQHARVFAGGAAKLRVYNPRVDEHGWQSTHTVVEIVNDDMPFLVDSITMEVNRQGLTLHLIVHPVMRVWRDAQHKLVALENSKGEPQIASAAADDKAKGKTKGKGKAKDQASKSAQDLGQGRLESLIHVEVDRRTDPAQLKALQEGLQRILLDVRASVEDWQAMRQAVLNTVQQLEEQPAAGSADELAEDLAFLRWLADDNFTLLGQRDYDLVEEAGVDSLRVLPGSGLGILRGGAGAAAASASFAALPAEVKAQARQTRALLLTKSNARSTVHRPGHLDYVGVKRFDAKGQVVGERRFLGLFTSIAYNAKAADIPLLRRKVAAVIGRAGFLPRSHTAKALVSILEQFPRDELFQIGIDELFNTAIGILRLGERQRTRLFVHLDAYGRFASCLVYVPRENYNTDVRARMQKLLTEHLHGESSEFSVQFSDSPLARVLITVRMKPGSSPSVDVRELERQLVSMARRWEDGLRDALVEACGEERGNQLHERYANGFSAGYRDEHAPRLAVHDIELMETLGPGEELALSLYTPLEAPPGELRFRMLRAGQLAPLSHSLPMLENMGLQVLEEHPYEVQRSDGTALWIDDFSMRVPGREDLDVLALRERFHDAFLRTWHGENDNDPFNRLVLLAGLDWRAVSLLRAYMRYMKQATFTFSRAYIQQAMGKHAAIAADLVALFQARFDPELSGDREAAQAEITARIHAALDTVSNLDEDRIVRQYLALIQATLRTNYFQRTAAGGFKPVMSFKFDPAKVPGLPEPKPMFEIFVSSPRVEGVHLRGGRVARGGLRWSDRIEDYRTEVLGLVKAQQVKNAVIVPVGSKGGFVLKRPPPPGDREALMKEGVACYQAYLRGLLDLTDNRVGDQIVPPPQLVRHDGDDPYLVVAADKGTATFSDIANAIAAEYGFWLGDAFASGGSVGYDHKKMGITARGAWESVKFHFRSRGLDTQSQDFTVVGVGDMSGDVFGNGMLLSRHIRLLAAFDHRHIFIDPEPDTSSSFKERERLFQLPRSSWEDYDKGLISAGGGVFARDAKSITLSAKAKSVLGIAAEVEGMTPAELMRALLLAPADLFYNGGIGTYFKASSESHADCGDRANDAIRVDGRDLRCKVVAEGGNLGATQRGRIEFALAGGLINTDAIDNSAGVDCSDHEVNIKILLGGVMADGDMTAKQRDKLLAEMTDDVAALCLRDNTFQNQVLGVTVSRSARLLDEQGRYMRHLVAAGRLNRRIEFLPSDEELAERRLAGQGLTTPELAVLLAYSKMELYDQVLASDVPEDPYIATALERYFPARLREAFAAPLQRHPLKREIVATHVVNSMVNRVGPTFVHRLVEETGSAPPDIVRAYLGTREIFGLVSIWEANDTLDHVIDMPTQQDVVRASVRLLERSTLWLLRQRSALRDMAATIQRFSDGVAQVGQGLSAWMVSDEQQALKLAEQLLGEKGLPATLAQRVAALDSQAAGLDIVEVAEELGLPLDAVGSAYFGVGGRLELGWVSQQIATLPADTRWQALARLAMRSDLSALARELTRSALRCKVAAGAADEQDQSTQALIDCWLRQHEFAHGRVRQLLADLKPTPVLDMPMLSVLLRELRAMV